MTDEKTGERSLMLRLRKRKYMHGKAIEAFKRLEGMETGPDSAAKAEAKLVGPRFVIDLVSVKDLQTRMAEIISGEATPNH